MMWLKWILHNLQEKQFWNHKIHFAFIFKRSRYLLEYKRGIQEGSNAWKESALVPVWWLWSKNKEIRHCWITNINAFTCRYGFGQNKW